MFDHFRDFIQKESASGILLIFSAIIALIVANSPLSVYYDQLLEMPVAVIVGPLEIAKPLLLWINDGLMAIFFFVVGLELKRELLEGELSEPSKLILPGVGAIGGMLVPALVYSYFNWNDSVAMSGWAIPAATDIAFALGILALLGNRVPLALKVFLVSLAIIDDIGAIVIIAAFYTSELSQTALIVAALTLPILYILNRRKVTNLAIYLLIGIVLWVGMLKSGVHATLAGVLLAFFIPLRIKNECGRSPAKMLEHDLHMPVGLLIVPIFAFANAGVNLDGISWDVLTHPITLGIALGLFIGKQVGVMLFSGMAIKLKWVKMPEGMSWMNLYGLSLLTGIGFTMSLFISSLAFEQGGETQAMFVADRLGVLVGSTVSAIAGYLVLKFSLPKTPQ